MPDRTRFARPLTGHPNKIVLWGLMLVIGGGLAWLSVAQWQGFNLPTFDLGAIAQSIWNAAYRAEPLIYTRKGLPVSRLANHVEFIYFLLVPLYWVWPSPAALLTFQAMFFALGAYPVYRIAHRRWRESWMAIAAAAIYLFLPVAQTAVLFEFHADALAMPLLLFALDAIDRRAWRAGSLWLGLALSCKFYVAVPIFALGGLLWWCGQQRAGGGVMLLAASYGAFAFFVVRPAFAPPVAAQLKATVDSYLFFYFGQLYRIRQTIALRLVNGAIVLTPVLLLGRRAIGWLLVAGTILGPVLLSSGPGPTYSYEFHHYALAVPFLMMAVVDGATAARVHSHSQAPGERRWQFAIIFTLGITLLLNMLLVDTPLNPRFYAPPPRSAQGLDPTGYQVTARDKFKQQWLATAVPPTAPIAADRVSALHLLERPLLYLNLPMVGELSGLLPDVDYLISDALSDFMIARDGERLVGGVQAGQRALPLMLRSPEWRLLAARDGLLLFGRDEEGLAQRVETAPITAAPSLMASFDDKIGLKSVEITPLGSRRFMLHYEWLALDDLSSSPQLMAVTHPEGMAFARIVHLPTLAALPTTGWPADRLVRESFVVELPADASPGVYDLSVSWYDTDDVYAPETDERSRIGDLVPVGQITLSTEGTN